MHWTQPTARANKQAGGLKSERKSQPRWGRGSPECYPRLAFIVLRSRTRAAACLVLLLSCCAPVFAHDGDHSEGLRLLFIGNSLTYTNDLPAMLAGLLEWADVAVARIESQARPDFGLQDHWSSTRTRRVIESEHWDIVILQQGPSATEGRPSLLEFSQLFAAEIRKVDGKPALYMVWPSTQRLRDFPAVADSYRSAAEQVDGLIFPVGEAWMAAWMKDPKLPLYGRDGFHPARLGTYLAALVMFEQLAGQDPRTLPAMIPGLHKGDPMVPERARVLQNAAVEANARVGWSCIDSVCEKNTSNK